jgi:thiosulfate reductase cytochrome b subunit
VGFPTTGPSISHEIALSHATIQPAWVRITHWINALAVVLMVMSGWRVYDASPIFPFLRFPSAITLGNWLGGALLWHFAVMWLLREPGIQLVRRLLNGAGSLRSFRLCNRNAALCQPLHLHR